MPAPETTPKRRGPFASAMALGFFAAIVSVAICTAVYLFTGILPDHLTGWIIQIGLPFMLPLTVSPILTLGMFRATQSLRDRTQQLEAEIAARRSAEERLAVLATVDDLTQVLNRREFFARAASLAQNSRGPMVVAILDLDHFKLLNDTAGHSAGDEVLQRYGAMLRERTSTERSAVVGRLGGEEFGVILPARTLDPGDRAAITVFEDIRRASEAMDGHSITTSIGVSDWAPPDDTIDAALGRADGALYRAKQLGRNNVQIARRDDYPDGVPSDGSPVSRR